MSREYIKRDDQDDSVKGRRKLGDLAALGILLRFSKGHGATLVLALLCLLLFSTAAMVSARALGFLVDDGLLPGNSDVSWKWAFVVVALEVVALVLQWGGRKLMAIGGAKTILTTRHALFAKLQELPLSFLDRQPQGRIVTRMTHDVEKLEDFFTSSLGRVVNAAFIAAIAMVTMLISDLKLGIILVVSMIPAVGFVLMTRSRVRALGRRRSRFSSALNSRLSEYINGLEVIRLFGLEEWTDTHFKKSVGDLTDNDVDANRYFAWTRPLIAFFTTLPLLGLVWFGGSRVLGGTLEIGLFVAFVRYTERFINPVLALARELHVIQQAFNGAERIASFLSEDEETQVLGEDGHKDCQELTGSLVFDNVWMAYQGENWVLKSLSFQARPGEKLGLVGRTGCGKTTTVSLILRLYEFQRGQILLDGHDIRSFKRDSLRDNIGFVGQDVVIIKGTVRENLILGRNISEEALMAAARETGLWRVLSSSGRDMESDILEGGVNLSAGERQLLALTRVLLGDPVLLVLDEATANVDPEHENIIQEAVFKVMKGRTCFIIAHRLATLEQCDTVLVFSGGQLIEQGSQEELLSKKGHFYRLQTAQEPSRTMETAGEIS